MKSLVKSLLPVLFSSVFAFGSLNSKAQDFLPGKFRDYREKEVTLLHDTIFYSRRTGRVFKERHYDIDNDSSWDAIEFYSITLDYLNKPTYSEYPVMYFLKFDEQNIKILIDEGIDKEPDGLNNNEKIYNAEDKDLEI